MSGFTSIKVQAEFAELVRVAAARSHRSVAGQLEYWARIGRAVERLPLARKHVEAAAHGTLDAAALNPQIGSSEDTLIRTVPLGNCKKAPVI